MTVAVNERNGSLDFRLGSFADIARRSAHVCFTPERGTRGRIALLVLIERSEIERERAKGRSF